MAQNPIFLGVDTPDIEHAEQLGRAVAPYVGGLKLGLEFFMANGPAGVARMNRIGLPLFLDVKLHDIPNTVAGALRALAPLDIAIVNVHAGGGPAMLRAAVDARPPQAKLIAVTVLTSLDEADLTAMGVSDGPASQVERLAGLARENGLDGVVCSPMEVGALSANWPGGLFVVPGIRPAGSAVGDQKRIMTPRQALDAGASILVIGRPITQAADPASAAAVIAETLQ